MKRAILSLGLLVAAGPARADEEVVQVEDLPAAVRTAVKAKFPGAKVVAAAREEEGGKTVYEVSLKERGVGIDVAVSARGRVLEVERTIAADKLPGAVADAINARHPGAEIKKAEEVVEYEDGDDEEQEEKSYEVKLSVGGKAVEVKLSPKGKILDDEEEEGDGEGAREGGEDED